MSAVNYPAVASLFSTVVMSTLAKEHIWSIRDRLNLLARLPQNQTRGTTLGQAFDNAYNLLVADYRSEYVFKNILMTNLLDVAQGMSAVLEQHMGDSRADLMILGDTSTVYEVKTDLDQFVRLPAQLTNYCYHAEFVYVVVSEKRAVNALTHTPAHVGLMAVQDDGSVRVVRQATSNMNELKHEQLFRLLRAKETHQLIKDMPNFRTHTSSLNSWQQSWKLFSELSLAEAQSGVVDQFRARGARAQHLITADQFPESLWALAYSREYSRKGMELILTRLRQPVSSFILR
jgi:hypothetical protein